jgi:polyhydroxybutyrate depolymerase
MYRTMPYRTSCTRAELFSRLNRFVVLSALLTVASCSESGEPDAKQTTGIDAMDETTGPGDSAAPPATSQEPPNSVPPSTPPPSSEDDPMATTPRPAPVTPPSPVSSGGAPNEEGSGGNTSATPEPMRPTPAAGGAPAPGAGGMTEPDGPPPFPSMDAGTSAAGSEGSTPDEGGSGASIGCGTETSLVSGRATIDVSGAQREYILTIPDGYDSSMPYKLVFGLHWRGGQASDVATGGTIGLGNYYGLYDLSDGNTIFVAPEGLDNGWANTGGGDIALMRAIVALFEEELCIDLDRIFSVGFSYGGMMSFAIACEMGDVFRAIAPISGALYSGCGNGTDPIAMWGAHGTSDTVVPIGDGRGGLQEVLTRNNCGEQTTDTSPSPCVSYEGCDEGYPVTWCEFDGGHSPSGWMSEPIWEFFSQF